jgi:hypothetical protein
VVVKLVVVVMVVVVVVVVVAVGAVVVLVVGAPAAPHQVPRHAPLLLPCRLLVIVDLAQVVVLGVGSGA